MSDSQLNKLKSGIQSGNKINLKLSLNVVGDPNDETNFPHKLLSIHAQAFANNSSADIKLWKTQLQKLGQSGEFLGRL